MKFEDLKIGINAKNHKTITDIILYSEIKSGSNKNNINKANINQNIFKSRIIYKILTNLLIYITFTRKFIYKILVYICKELKFASTIYFVNTIKYANEMLNLSLKKHSNSFK